MKLKPAKLLKISLPVKFFKYPVFDVFDIFLGHFQQLKKNRFPYYTKIMR